MKSIFLVALFSLLFLGFAVAQGDPALPADWGALITLLIAGIPALVAAFRKPVNWAELVRSRTFWSAVSGFLTAIGLFVAGQIGLPSLIGALYLALVAIFIRDAVTSGSKANEKTGGNVSAPIEFDRFR